MVKLTRSIALGVLLSAGMMGSAHAALIGVTQQRPDVTLGTSSFVYDHNAINASTGLLTIFAPSSTLFNSAGSNVSTQTHNPGNQDAANTLMLTFAIDNSTGALAASSSYNSVNILTGNATGSNFTFSWLGNITNFGFTTAGSGTRFDAQWTLTGDTYQAGSSWGGVDLSPTGATPGGIIFNTSSNIAVSNAGGAALSTDSSLFLYDWTVGSLAAGRLSDTGFTTANNVALAGNYFRASTATQGVDAFVTPVPIPGAALLLVSGLGLLAPMRRRRVSAQGRG